MSLGYILSYGWFLLTLGHDSSPLFTPSVGIISAPEASGLKEANEMGLPGPIKLSCSTSPPTQWLSWDLLARRLTPPCPSSWARNGQRMESRGGPLGWGPGCSDEASPWGDMWTLLANESKARKWHPSSPTMVCTRRTSRVLGPSPRTEKSRQGRAEPMSLGLPGQRMKLPPSPLSLPPPTAHSQCKEIKYSLPLWS